jgi:hypothetical protein
MEPRENSEISSGAEGGSRTRTTLRSTDFKSLNVSFAEYLLMLLSASEFTKTDKAVKR